MDLIVLNKNLDAISVIDIYESFIWTDRYYAYGDFELYTTLRKDILDYLKKDHYIVNQDSEHVMIIEDLVIKTDLEDGAHLTVAGRSLESILNRRIIWGQQTIKGNLQAGIAQLLIDNIMDPTDPSRKIDNFIFEASDDPAITELTISAQYTGDNLYDVIGKICSEHEIGFKITLNNNKQFVFKLYAGVDRSYEQTENPYVVFSPNFENLLNSNYAESKSSYKNVTLVGGQGEGAARIYVTVGSASGLDRRELFTNASDISTEGNGDYNDQLTQRGNEQLEEYAEITSFEGEAETTFMFKYGVDFFNGDVVQVANEYGHESPARVVEVVRSEDENGYSVYPTFKYKEKGE